MSAVPDSREPATKSSSAVVRPFPRVAAETIMPAATDRASTLAAIRDAIAAEQEGLARLHDKVDDSAVRAVEALDACNGRLIVAGMGKMGWIGRKISATFCSIGLPSVFLHPSEAIHGDLGILAEGDVLLALSNSGETEEVLVLMAHVKRFGTPVVSLTGNPSSSLARYSDIVIDVGVEREADPLNLLPTASAAACLAMGDALAAAIVARRGFSREQFALFHPGGNLGRQLLWTVADLMHKGDRIPAVRPGALLKEALVVMTSKTLGAAFVVDAEGKLAGVYTDGDLRRTLERDCSALERPIDEVMTVAPKTVAAEALAAEALHLMESKKITVLPAIDEAGRVVGAIHLHDLVRAGLA